MIKINGTEFAPTKFPNGEIGFELDVDECVNIDWFYQDDNELLQLAFIANQCFPGGLNIHYLPYSRMDRIKGNWAFTLKTVCNMINDMNWSYVNVAEPHSDVCIALLNNARAYYPTRHQFDHVCEDIGFEKGVDVIVFPDAGAEKRYASMYPGHKTMVGFKRRDFDTGKIQSFNLVNNTDGKIDHSCKAIIIDDLCSYGGTFLATAETLDRDYGILEATLLVAHLETSVHGGDMITNPIINRIYATKSIYKPLDRWAFQPHPKIKIYEVN